MRTLVPWLAAIAAACSTRTQMPPSAPRGDAAARAADRAPTVERAEPTPAPWLGAREVASNGGTYLVRWRSEPTELPRGPLFAIDAWVFDARAPDAPLADVELVVDAAMPEHLHGMNRVPTIARSGQGFRVEGMKLHMPGNWELYFDVVRGPIVERAQERFELE